MSDDLKQLAQEAGSRYARAVGLGREDLQLRAVKYLLLRLTVGGLHNEELARLRALASAALLESDVSNEAEAIQKKKDSSPLALTLAGIVAEARGSKRAAMLGAVLGAHAAHGARGGEDARDGRAEMQGAVVGAAILETHRMLEEMIAQPSWSDFSTRE
jgi:folate-dependent tRNA-U54 methylase TrmFO/GidA